MSDLGVRFEDTSGQLTFDSSVFSSATTGQSAALTSFLGTSTTSGFLYMATNAMKEIEDPTTGMLTNEINSTQSQIISTNTQITDQENQVNLLQTSLTNEMSSADAMIYQMQQQQTYFQEMFQATTAQETAGL